jgi:hypothetical protein
MSSIQGVQAVPAYTPASPVQQAQPAIKAPASKTEIQETSQDERQEALGGRQEIGEGGSSGVGTRFSTTA